MVSGVGGGSSWGRGWRYRRPGRWLNAVNVALSAAILLRLFIH
jgi:hypothetical protein